MLRLNQKLHALRTFIIPKLDYLLMNGLVSKLQLEKLDKRIRALIHHHVGNSNIPVDVFYTHWADGGLSLPRLTERSQMLSIKLFYILRSASDDKIRELTDAFVRDEIRFRKATVALEEQRFEHIMEDESRHILHMSNRKTNCCFVRAFNASRRLNLKINTSEENQLIYIKDLSSDSPSVECRSPKDINKTINLILRRRHKKDLYNLPLHGHSFKSLEGSPYSNRFIIDYRRGLKDSIQKFSLVARSNCLPTKEIMALSNPDRVRTCPRCGGDNESLMHILNNCRPSLMPEYTKRHNAVVTATVDLINECCKPAPIIHLSKSVKPHGVNLNEFSSLKPDIWYEDSDGHIVMLEVTVPYASYREDGSFTLELRRDEKLQKYRGLQDAIEEATGLPVDYHVIIVSSLGMVLKDTARQIRNFTTKKSLINKYLQRLSELALGYSCKTFWNAVTDENHLSHNTYDSRRATSPEHDSSDEVELQELFDESVHVSE